MTHHELNPQHANERLKSREIIMRSIGSWIFGAAETLDEIELIKEKEQYGTQTS